MKKLLSTAMALVLIIGLLTGCSVESQGEKTESVSNQYYLYYLNKDETKVTKTRYYPEQESAEFMLQDLMGIRMDRRAAERTCLCFQQEFSW